MLHVFIINPVAGSRKYFKIIPLIEDYFKDKEESYEIKMTLYPKHATKIASLYQGKDVRLYACGGDGTLNEVLNGINPGIPLSIIPLGSGNDFFKSLDINKCKNLVIDTIEGSSSFVDYLIINDTKCLNCVTIGFDSQINDQKNKLGYKWYLNGSISYLISIFLTLKNLKYSNFTLQINGQTKQVLALLMVIANGRYYGGGIKPVPRAKINDGLFDVCIIDSISLAKIFMLLPFYLIGKHEKFKEATFLVGNSVVIESKEPLIVGYDGEIIKTKLINVNLIPQGLEIIRPKKEER